MRALAVFQRFATALTWEGEERGKEGHGYGPLFLAATAWYWIWFLFKQNNRQTMPATILNNFAWRTWKKNLVWRGEKRGWERRRSGGMGSVVGKWTKVWQQCGLEWHSNRILLQLWQKLPAKQKLCQQIDIASNLARQR